MEVKDRFRGQRPTHLAVLVETDDTWGRDVVDAIVRYAQDANWTVLLCPRDAQRRLRLPRDWRGDGIIVSLRDKSIARHVQQSNVPAVDVSMTLPEERWLGRVATDDQVRAEMAFDHLYNLGLRDFACYAPPNGRYPDQRGAIFSETVRRGGCGECASFRGNRSGRGSSWQAEYKRVVDWLSPLPQPLAVFASDPYPARQLAEISHAANIRIPDQLAVVAGDNDDLLCNVAWPPISSVQLASHQIGLEACQMLVWMRRTGRVPTAPKLIPPLRVYARHSTEILAIQDDDVSEILRFIRSRATEGMQVGDLLTRFPISRRTLEIRFRELLGRSPAEEIRRVKLEAARALVLDTDLSISAIANRCSFADGASLSHAFRKYLRVTPGELRSARRQSKSEEA